MSEVTPLVWLFIVFLGFLIGLKVGVIQQRQSNEVVEQMLWRYRQAALDAERWLTPLSDCSADTATWIREEGEGHAVEGIQAFRLRQWQKPQRTRKPYQGLYP